MGRLVIGVIGAAAIAALVATTLALRPRGEGAIPAPAATETAKTETAKPEAAKGAVPTLYCEFTNFADRNPLVGFYFTIEEGEAQPVYAQIFQREQDGTQEDFGTGPRPAWAFDGSQSPPVISSPDGAMQINLYDYDPKKPGSNWFEAGLRSIRYRNLGGRCRHSAA